MATWLTHWLTNIAEPSVRYSTFMYYEGGMRIYLVPRLGQHKLDKLEPEHIESMFRAMRQDGHKPSVMNQAHRTLRAALNEAVRRGHIWRNPAMLVRAPSVEEIEVEPFSIKQAQPILNVARERRNGARFAIALSLGLRRGEALGLQWRDLDTKAETLAVRRALQRQTWRHGCDDPHACGARFHRLEACRKSCRQHGGRCPKPCTPSCAQHARACPKRTDSRRSQHLGVAGDAVEQSGQGAVDEGH